MTARKDRERRAIAYHEAGHAVGARVLGVGITHAALFPIAPGATANVQTKMASWLARDADQATLLAAIEMDAKVALAGARAEHKHRAVRKAPTGWSDDIERAGTLVAQGVRLLRDGIRPGEGDVEIKLNDEVVPEAKQLFDRLSEETENLVEQNWPAIERVAEALLRRPLLNQDDVDALIADRQPLLGGM